MYTWKSHFVVQADYQHWANEVLFASLDHLTPEALQQDEGLYFRSIHHTVDHILMVSRLWAGRLRGETPTLDMQRIHYPDWRTLKQELRLETRHLQDWLDQQDEYFFEERLIFTSRDGRQHDMWIREVLTHLFTHYAHHRGQVSAVATRLGAPCPEMDFFYYRREMNKILNEARGEPAP